MRIELARMRDLPVGHRQAIRELSLGPTVAWGSWSWTFQDGSCWAACALQDDAIVGWAALTLEVDMLPVLGAYVAESHRKQGIGSMLVTTLLRYLLGKGVLTPGVEIFNSTWRFESYAHLLQSCGLRSRKWM